MDWTDATLDQVSLSETPSLAGTGKERQLRIDLPSDDRYAIVDELGAGGAGKVYLAFDHVLGRHVAYKVLHGAPDPAAGQHERFVSECQAAAQLEHPSIVPIHDLGIRGDGSVFFTMKAVRGKSLKQHIEDVAQGRAAPGMTRYRLLQLLHQVCLAISYMHARKVLHRDLKPQNVMIGEFGEVYVVDFGLAKVRGPAVTTLRSEAGDSTDETVIQGTLAYMPPEQAADPDSVDESSDQFALGAILYEILTHRPPYTGAGRDMWPNVLTASFPPPGDLDPTIPPSLAEICTKAMARHKHDRFRSTRELADSLQEFLDGEKELERRAAIARVALGEAEEQLKRYEELEREATTVAAEVQATRDALPRLASADARSRLYRLQERSRHMVEARDRAFADAIRQFVRTIDIAPDARRARELLADLCYRKMIELEDSGRSEEMATYRALVESYHDGKYTEQLRGDGLLRVSSQPSGAHAYLATFAEHGPRLAAESERYLGATPTPPTTLPMGSYLLTLRHEGHADAVYPFVIGRNENVQAEIALIPIQAITPGFAYVPAGPFLAAANPMQPGRRRRCISIDGFCIARNPVTMAEYLEFINYLAATAGADVAIRRAPRVEPDAGHYFLRQGDTFALPDMDRDGDRWDPRWPVFGVSAEDAEAYCAWMAARDGLPYRLPTSEEWEKAACGADGRAYPWGNGWEEGLSRSLTEEALQLPEPVGRATDVSVYGVLGLTGNVRDWTSSVRPGTQQMRVLRGGDFATGELAAQIGVLQYTRPNIVSTGVGFRLALTVRTQVE